eukprot:9185337-Lingulodinium_polyedra.AAC.1
MGNKVGDVVQGPGVLYGFCATAYIVETVLTEPRLVRAEMCAGIVVAQTMSWCQHRSSGVSGYKKNRRTG